MPGDWMTPDQMREFSRAARGASQDFDDLGKAFRELMQQTNEYARRKAERRSTGMQQSRIDELSRILADSKRLAEQKKAEDEQREVDAAIASIMDTARRRDAGT